MRLQLSPRRRTRHDMMMLWVKSISWRAVSTGILVLVGKVVTDEWSTGGMIAFIHMVITIVLYVPHDLLWERWDIRAGDGARAAQDTSVEEAQASTCGRPAWARLQGAE